MTDATGGKCIHCGRTIDDEDIKLIINEMSSYNKHMKEEVARLTRELDKVQAEKDRLQRYSIREDMGR